MYSSTHLRKCFVTTELSCRPNRIAKSSVQLVNRDICLCDNRDPTSQEHVFFVVFHFELTPFSDDQLVSAQPIVFNWEIH